MKSILFNFFTKNLMLNTLTGELKMHVAKTLEQKCYIQATKKATYLWCDQNTRGLEQEVRTLTWHHHLVTALATVPVLSGATLATHDLAVIPGAERLGSQRLVALGAAETVLVPVAVLVVQLLGTEREVWGEWTPSSTQCSCKLYQGGSFFFFLNNKYFPHCWLSETENHHYDPQRGHSCSMAFFYHCWCGDNLL